VSVSYPSFGDRVRIKLVGELFDMTGIVDKIEDRKNKEPGKVSMFLIRIPSTQTLYWMRRSDFTIIGEA